MHAAAKTEEKLLHKVIFGRETTIPLGPQPQAGPCCELRTTSYPRLRGTSHRSLQISVAQRPSALQRCLLRSLGLSCPSGFILSLYQCILEGKKQTNGKKQANKKKQTPQSMHKTPTVRNPRGGARRLTQRVSPSCCSSALATKPCSLLAPNVKAPAERLQNSAVAVTAPSAICPARVDEAERKSTGVLQFSFSAVF